MTHRREPSLGPDRLAVDGEGSNGVAPRLDRLGQLVVDVAARVRESVWGPRRREEESERDAPDAAVDDEGRGRLCLAEDDALRGLLRAEEAERCRWRARVSLK